MKNSLSKLILISQFFHLTLAPFVFAEPPVSSKPKYGPSAIRLQDSHVYLQRYPAPDFWSLISYYLPQQSSRSCSAATLAMLVNAARSKQKLNTSDVLVTESGVLDKVNSVFWKMAVGEQGKGVTLEQLSKLANEALGAYGVKTKKVGVYYAETSTATTLKKLHRTLEQNEQNKDDFVIVNFQQSILTGDPEGAVGHIAPVAAFDLNTKKALILDPDRRYYEPYWVSEDLLLSSMNTKDPVSEKYRGWIHIQIGD